MLIYRKGSPWHLIFGMFGSALPRSMIPGLVSAMLAFALDQHFMREYLNKILEHPYAFQPFAYIAAFALVFRTNIAYNRYWEMATQVTLMSSKWADAAVEAITFDELPRGKSPEERGRKLASRRRFQALMVRRYSCMHAIALQYLRRDDHLDNLCRRDPSAPTTVPMGLGTFGGLRGPADRAEAAWQLLEVLGGLCEYERALLYAAHDRVGYLFSNIIHLANQRRADGNLGVDAPVLSRYYQLTSDGMLGFRQARKIEDLPFPWPYTQAVSAFLAMFTIGFPLILAKFANEDAAHGWVGPVISFVTVSAYTVLHKVARALEDPFVHPPNDLPANALQAAFNLRLLSAWDSVRRPEDALYGVTARDHSPGGYCFDGDIEMRSPPMSPGSDVGEPGSISREPTPGGFSQDDIEDEAALWEEYAYLEPEEVFVQHIPHRHPPACRGAPIGLRSPEPQLP